jgi:hypothetical protein
MSGTVVAKQPTAVSALMFVGSAVGDDMAMVFVVSAAASEKRHDAAATTCDRCRKIIVVSVMLMKSVLIAKGRNEVCNHL